MSEPGVERTVKEAGGGLTRRSPLRAMSAGRAPARPDQIERGQAVAIARAQITRELCERHATTLSTVLAQLRSGVDSVRRAEETASHALIEVRREAAAPSQRPVASAITSLFAQLERLARAHGLVFQPAVPDTDGPHPTAAVVSAAEVITRAAADNVVEHAGAKRLRVAWDLDGSALVVSVVDDGRGFSLPAVDGPGLDRMRRSAAAVGGELRVDSTEGWGTQVHARLPLEDGARAVADDAAALRVAQLGPREREVLELVIRGMRNREIAETLDVSIYTVKFHVRNVLQKLGVRSRSEAVAVVAGLRTGEPR